MDWRCPILHSHFSAYLESNQAPTKEDMKEIRELKTSLATILTHLGFSIGALDAINDKNERIDALQHSIARCGVILSPARHVPKEIWGEIFTHCLSTDRNPVLSYNEAPLLLTHVSTFWRSTARSTPQIWARIHIPIFQQPLNPTLAILPTGLAYQDFAGYAIPTSVQYDQIHLWLQLSGSLPLKITVSAQYALRSTEHHQLLHTLCLFSNRFQSLDLDFHAIDDISAMALPAEHLLMLENLSIRSATMEEISNTKGILSAPRLRELTIGAVPYNGFPLPYNWSKLVKLSIQNPIDDVLVRRLLTHCSFLVHCTMEIGSRRRGFVADMDEIDDIHLPHLENLTIIDPTLGTSFDVLFRWLSPPNLRYLQWFIQRSSFPNFSYYITLAGNTSPRSILAPDFLPRLGKLETLVINPDDFSQEEILRCLSLLPSVKHLILGSRTEGFVQGLGTYTPKSLETDILKLLSTPRPTDSSPHPNFLLPNLVNVEYYGALPSDQDILYFIITRMSVDPTQGPSLRLRRFTAWAENRDMETDISSKVHDHSGSLGVPFELEISYTNSTTRFKDIIYNSTEADIYN